MRQHRACRPGSLELSAVKTEYGDSARQHCLFYTAWQAEGDHDYHDLPLRVHILHNELHNVACRYGVCKVYPLYDAALADRDCVLVVVKGAPVAHQKRQQESAEIGCIPSILEDPYLYLTYTSLVSAHAGTGAATLLIMNC